MSKIADDMKKALGVDITDKMEVVKYLQAAALKWLPDEKFKEQFDFGVEIAKDKGEDDIIMQFWLYGLKGDDEWAAMPTIVATGFDDEKQKFTAMEGIGAEFVKNFPDHRLVNIVQVSEMWRSMRSADQPDEDKHIAPSESPNREEIVIVSAMSMDMRQGQFTANITRHADGSFDKLVNEDYKLHDSTNPIDPNEMKNYLSASIMHGYYTAKGYGK